MVENGENNDEIYAETEKVDYIPRKFNDGEKLNQLIKYYYSIKIYSHRTNFSSILFLH